jgi:hypothetical protein
MLGLWRTLLASLLIALATSYAALAQNDSVPARGTYVSLGFAAQDLTNPVSMFGHTFLILSKDFPPEPSAKVIDFVADLTDDGLFAIHALSGTSKGIIRQSTLIEREFEYDRENRNLYYYQLKLSAVERDRLLAMTSSATGSPESLGHYGFFKRNCAFIVFEMVIEATGGTVPFTIAHVPMRGLKELDRRGLLARPFYFKASSAYLLSRAIDQLSRDDYYAFDSIRWGSDLGPRASNELKNAIQRLAVHKLPREPLESERTRFLALTKVNFPRPEEKAPDPLAGFYADWLIFQAGYEYSQRNLLSEITYTPTIRHSLNFLWDEFRFSQLVMGRISVATRGKSFRVSDITLIELDAAAPAALSKVVLGRYLRIGFDYWRGAEVRWGIGPSLGAKSFSISAQPFVGFKVWGEENGRALKQSFQPQLGARLRLDFLPSHRTAFRLSATQLFVSKFRPELRLESEFAIRSGRWTPFLRFRRLAPFQEASVNDLTLGLALGF